ncbi:sulfite exporter TauE/SafE family protein, partial [Candidatus Pelagibacter sp.]|nr:sulfite exporter TauE/SafE family protein [Candidatus Pelagibacter sp.]
MDILSYFQLSFLELNFIILTVFIASIVRGFNGFGFSATCISGFSFILPAIEIVPIILALEVVISVFMVPYIWNKIEWKFVFKILLGMIIGSPIGLYLLKYLNPQVTHLFICLLIIFFSVLLMKGFSN